MLFHYLAGVTVHYAKLLLTPPWWLHYQGEIRLHEKLTCICVCIWVWEVLDSVGAVSMAGLLLCSMYPSTTVFALMLLLADPFRNWVNFVCLVLQCAGKSIWESIEMLVSFCLFSLYQLMQFACCLPVLLQLWYVRTSCKLHSGCSDCLVCSKTPNALMFRLYWMGRALIGFNIVFWNCIRSRCCDNSFFCHCRLPLVLHLAILPVRHLPLDLTYCLCISDLQ